jgi:hypothetical protein
MVFQDTNQTIYEFFYLEFVEYPILLQTRSNWCSFIQNKDLGIKYLVHKDRYEIVDAKKWIIARLQYGI